MGRVGLASISVICQLLLFGYHAVRFEPYLIQAAICPSSLSGKFLPSFLRGPPNHAITLSQSLALYFRTLSGISMAAWEAVRYIREKKIKCKVLHISLQPSIKSRKLVCDSLLESKIVTSSS